jgi:plastocyanin
MNHVSVARRGLPLVLVFALAVALAACASDLSSGSPGGGSATVSGGVVEISATGADFSVSTITAKAGEPFTARFTNHDPVAHDFALFTREGGELIVRSELITGPNATTEVKVPALDAGTYFFHCDPHADHMKGSLVVEP